MKSSTKKDQDAQGAQDPQQKILSIADVDGYLSRDIQTAVICLKAVLDDPDARLALATVLHGKYLNKLQKEANPVPVE